MIFDPRRVALHQRRAREDFLLREMLARLADRLQDINRTFPVALDIGSHGLLADYLPASAGVEKLMQAAFSEAEIIEGFEGECDLIVACGNLHWINDLPGALVQMQRLLKPDGLLLAMLPGGETLTELRTSFEAAEMEMTGGLSPRISPFVDIRDAGALLQRAGFALPVADSELLEIQYNHPLKLLHELRNMGQSNALMASQKTFTPCSLMMRMCDIYMDRFSNEEGRIMATFDLLTLTGWKPHASQPKPAKRGSGTTSLSILE